MDIGTILLFVILIILSAFFSSSEIGLISVPKHVIESLVKQGNQRAAQLLWLKERTDKLLITILIGNNLINTLIAALATKISLDVGRTFGFQEGLAVGIATGIITILLLLFGEILPKTLATRIALPFGLFIAPIYIFLVRMAQPFIRVIEKIIHLFDKPGANHIRTIKIDEIQALIDIATEQESIEPDIALHIKKIIDFHETTAQEIITPRIAIEALPNTATINEALEHIQKFSHTRIPIYEDNIDSIQRIISEKELLINKQKNLGDKKLSELQLQKAIKIPLTMPLDKVIEVFKHEHRQIAIVMDEYGGVAGLITLEDLIEEIFGDFIDETDKELIPIKHDGDTYIVQGSVLLDDILEKIGLHWHEIEITESDYSGETLSYFITSELERFPEQNETLHIKITPTKNILDDHKESKETNEYLTFLITKRDENSIQEVYIQYTSGEISDTLLHKIQKRSSQTQLKAHVKSKKRAARSSRTSDK